MFVFKNIVKKEAHLKGSCRCVFPTKKKKKQANNCQFEKFENVNQLS